MITIVQEAVTALGGQRRGGVNKLAEALGIARQNFYFWKRVPAERVLAMEDATGIPRWRIRPDLYAPPLEAAVVNVAAEAAPSHGNQAGGVE